MGIKLNRAELAEHIGVSVVTIDNWRKEGMPYVSGGSKGVAWTFDLAEVIKWWGDRRAAAAAGEAPSDLVEIERRTAYAKMQMAELELAKKRGEVALIRDYERAQSKAFAEIRTRVMNAPQRLVLQLIGCTDEVEFKKKMKAELALALQAAAEADLTLAEESDEADA